MYAAHILRSWHANLGQILLLPKRELKDHSTEQFSSSVFFRVEVKCFCIVWPGWDLQMILFLLFMYFFFKLVWTPNPPVSGWTQQCKLKQVRHFNKAHFFVFIGTDTVRDTHKNVKFSKIWSVLSNQIASRLLYFSYCRSFILRV